MIDLHVPFTPMQAPVAPAIKYGLHMLTYAYICLHAKSVDLCCESYDSKLDGHGPGTFSAGRV